MKSLMHSCLIVVALTGLACALNGCDREVSHTEKTTVKEDGTVKHSESTVKQSPDGTVTKEESSKTVKPNPPPPPP